MDRFTLPKLPYAFDALEPHIDVRTMEIHHGKHHAAYVSNLNAALEKAPRLSDVPLETMLSDLAIVPEEIRSAVRNNGGGHFNHSFFWPLLGPGKGGRPVGELGKAIGDELGSFVKLREQLEQAAMTRFGSGWAWLSVNREGRLVVHSTANQDPPLSEGLKPVLGVDVWEHAYYLRYQNRRAEYLTAWWNVVDWERAEHNFKAARG